MFALFYYAFNDMILIWSYYHHYIMHILTANINSYLQHCLFLGEKTQRPLINNKQNS